MVFITTMELRLVLNAVLFNKNDSVRILYHDRRIKMGLFGKPKENKERKELKGQIDKLMNDYSREKIDGETYFKKMMDLTTSHQKKKK